MHQHYHSGLVLVSIAVAILASYTALLFALRIRVATRQLAPAWLIGGGVAMGVGIWSMHFVGMLAMSLPVEISYGLELTLLSMLIAIVVSTFALRIASRDRVSRKALVGAGFAMGIGICAMHYVGMTAIRMDPPIRYDPAWVIISFVIAIAASFAALGVAFAPAGSTFWHRHRREFGAVGMGLAVAGMHYAGMVAARFPIAAVSGGAVVNKGWLAGSVTAFTLLVLLTALLVSLVEARTAKIQASLTEVAETNRAKDEFLAMLGHELRNPLAAISNAVHLLRRFEARNPQERLAHEMVARQTTHLTRMVDDLLDVGRAIAGKMSLQRERIDLNALVNDALRGLATADRTTDRQVTYTGTPVWVDADRTRLEQVLTNLVVNAVQHTASGGQIAVTISPRGDAVEIAVADDGDGMDPETAARVFELFYQAGQGPERKRGGLGIGLTLAKRIVDLHGGSIEVASAGPGWGATFTLRLPAIPAQSSRRAGTQGAMLQGTSRRVVIVEDSEDARVSLQLVLEAEGHDVRTAADGPSGVDVITRWRPDVAVVDIGLPGMDGYGVASKVRAAGLRTPLVALTGYGLPEDKQRALNSGFDAHLTKPAAIEQLLSLIAAAPRQLPVQG
jgi:signal transduction histidine kinase/CheY-like chemotaxis protein